MTQSKKNLEEICRRLSEKFADPKSELHFHSDYAFLVAVVLSAQTTDVQVNKVTKTLFAECPTIDDILALGQEKLQEKIKSIGFYKHKAKHIIELSRILKEKYDGKIPKTRAELESLPGVGRKTANVILNALFNEDTIAVDTHVLRLSKKLGFSDSSDPVKVEEDLVKKVPKKYQHDISNLLILHGRYTCKARKQECGDCLICDLCPVFVG